MNYWIFEISESQTLKLELLPGYAGLVQGSILAKVNYQT